MNANGLEAQEKPMFHFECEGRKKKKKITLDKAKSRLLREPDFGTIFGESCGRLQQFKHKTDSRGNSLLQKAV